MARTEAKDHGRKVVARKEAKDKKGGKGETRTCWMCGKTGHIAAWCRKGGKRNLYAMDEDDREDI